MKLLQKTCIVILGLMVMVGCQPKSSQEEVQKTRVIQSVGVSVQALTLVTEGKVAGDMQMAFLPPEDYKEAPENFQGWLLVYDQKPFDQVWDHLSGMALEDLKSISHMDEDNRGYFIEKYDYADGLGNTLNPGQKTLIDGKDLELGPYYFYVATVTSEGVVGMMEAREMMDIKPVPQNIAFTKDRGAYKVTFDPMVDERLQGHFLCLSEASLYDFKNKIATMTRADINKYVKDKQGLFLEPGLKEALVKEDLMTFEGKDSQKGILNLYVASLGQEGVLDVSRSVDFIIHEEPLNNKAEILHEGMGTVMLIGGGTASSDDSHKALFAAMLEAAGGKKPRLAILSSSRMDAMTVYDHFYYKDPEFGSFEDNYEKLGFEPVFIPLATDNGHRIKNDPYWVSVLASCHGAYLQGGDQYKHVKSLLNEDGSPSLMLEALKGILDRGGLVAGTSAGMAAMGDYAYGYGYGLEALTHNGMEFMTLKDIPLQESLVSERTDNNIATPGIGLISKAVLVDSHFDRRGRLGRLLVAMRDTEKTIGIGVDEGTALAIQNEIGTVIGHQGVFILDGSEAVYGQRGPDHLFLVENLKLHYLTEGDRYDFWSRNALQSKDKLPLEGLGTFSSEGQIFSEDYGTTKILLDFMASEETLLEIPYKLLNEKVITLAFEKTDKTKAYTSANKYEDPSLEGYHQSSIENLRVSIYENKDKDSLPPQIGYMTSYTKAYKVYLGITDNLSGIDEASINGETVTFTSDKNSLYRPPFYDAEYEEIAVVIAEDAFVKGDQVHVDGVKDLEGNMVESQTWEFDGTKWFKK